jgi:hypothetical protein
LAAVKTGGRFVIQFSGEKEVSVKKRFSVQNELVSDYETGREKFLCRSKLPGICNFPEFSPFSMQKSRNPISVVSGWHAKHFEKSPKYFILLGLNFRLGNYF